MLCRMNRVACVAAVVVGTLWVGALNAETIVNLTQPGDPLVAVYNTTAGGDSTTASGAMTGEAYGLFPTMAIDGYITGGKYLNFGDGGETLSTATKGVGTGFYVTPSMGASVLTGLYINTANDYLERDPMSITVEGSNASGSNLALGSSWTLIYSGPSGVEGTDSRSTWGNLVDMSTNSTGYTSYRMLVTAQRDVANCVQYAEVAFKGYAVPEPGVLSLLGCGAASLLAYVWRRRK